MRASVDHEEDRIPNDNRRTEHDIPRLRSGFEELGEKPTREETFPDRQKRRGSVLMTF